MSTYIRKRNFLWEVSLFHNLKRIELLVLPYRRLCINLFVLPSVYTKIERNKSENNFNFLYPM